MQPFAPRGAQAAPTGYSRRTPSIHYTNGAGDFAQPPKAARPRTQWLLLISPSTKLATSFGLDSQQGVLFPLKPSLQAQLVSATREFGLQHSMAFSLLLNLGEGLSHAKVTDECWTATWAQLPTSDSWSAIPPGPGVLPRISLPIAANLLLDFSNVTNTGEIRLLPEQQQVEARMTINQHRRRPSKPLFLRSSIPQLVASPEPLSLPFPGQPSPSVTQQASPTANVAAVLEVSTSPADELVGEVTEEADEAQTASWPPTPASPDRLPSASLMDRLADSASPCRPYFKDTESHFSKMSVSRDMGPLIEVSRDARVRPLAECSEPSPIISTFASVKDLPPVKTKLQATYPYNLSNIYEPVWPYITVYPSMQRHQSRPSPHRSSRQADSTSAASKPCIGTKLQSGYPYNLAHIYEPVWPYLSIYPSITWTQTSPCQSRTRPLAKSSNINAQALAHSISLRSEEYRPAYPFNLASIYPAVYPHFNLYPSIEASSSRPSHTRSPSYQKQLVYITQTYETDIKRPSEVQRPPQQRKTSRSSSLSQEVDAAPKLSSPTKRASIDHGEAIHAMNFRRRKIPAPISPVPQVVPLMLANDSQARRISGSSMTMKSPFHLSSPMLGQYNLSPSSPVFVA